ncbi:trypsin-like peptidase domain-containing protein [Alicyclobacillus tolerans]|uniref:S1C family serine protease n=1 Tax=Alicyclobacillus tolerans TaxID=90970 RepID=UPI001F2A8006|nr:trypsin-like peptidase domain-containing protein [Alicyclobacillus tolerans]MCF8567199.1 trypsin-like peptidase domain-containing protein [Alicyclobacillus tolerans]
MGFYTPKPDNNESRKKYGGRPGWAWLATVVLSALVGSGATLVALPALENQGFNVPAIPSPVQDTSATSGPASTVNVNVTDGITQVVKKAAPAVMGVVNYAMTGNPFSQQQQLQEYGVGTGVLFYKNASNGYVVTNNHVVMGAAKVQVVLESGQHVTAQVVGTDPYTDLAVLKIPLKPVANVTPLTFANSDKIQAGEPAIAIGTPMGLDFAESVTSGIVSAPKRIMPVQLPNSQQTLDYQSVIQTDAAINPGNSGGPLLNITGQVMGINSSKIAAPNFQGMGFAIPANEVQNIAYQLVKTGHAVHPALGIEGYSMSSLPSQYWPNVPVDYGVWVKTVTSSTAKAGGLKPQDVIVGIDGHTVKTMADLRTYLFQANPGQTVTLNVYRGSHRLTLKVKLGEMQTQNDSGATQQQLPQSSSDPLNPFGN